MKADDGVQSQNSISSDVSKKTESKSDVECVEKEKKSDATTQDISMKTSAVDEKKNAVGGQDKTDELNSETLSDKSDFETDNLTVDKASLLKSPSSQSIARPPPDHTDNEEAVLDKLASAASQKKV